jgi:predicted MFS family arabinose efflux permease
MGSAQNLWMLFVGRIIEGLSGGNLGTAQAAIADVTTREERSRSMGLIGAAFGMGFVLGPAIGAVSAAVFDSRSAPLYVSAGLALLNALFIAVCLPETLTPDRRKQAREEPTGTLLRGGDGADRRILLGVYFLGIAGFSVMTGVFSLYVENRHGFDVPKVGGLFAFIGVVGVLVQGGLVRRLLKRPIEKRTALAGSVVVAGSLLALPAVPDPVWLYVACAGLALGNGLFNPSLSGLASRLASATSQGRFLGMMQSAGSLGRFMGPIIGGGLLSKNPAGSYTPVAFWAAAGISLAAAGLLAGMRATDGSREPSKTGAAS